VLPPEGYARREVSVLRAAAAGVAVGEPDDEHLLVVAPVP